MEALQPARVAHRDFGTRIGSPMWNLNFLSYQFLLTSGLGHLDS